MSSEVMTVTEEGASVAFCWNLDALKTVGTSICINCCSDSVVRSSVWTVLVSARATGARTSNGQKKPGSHEREPTSAGKRDFLLFMLDSKASSRAGTVSSLRKSQWRLPFPACPGDYCPCSKARL